MKKFEMLLSELELLMNGAGSTDAVVDLIDWDRIADFCREFAEFMNDAVCECEKCEIRRLKAVVKLQDICLSVVQMQGGL